MRLRVIIHLLIITTIFILVNCQKPTGKMATITLKKGDFEVIIPVFGELKAVKSTPIIVPTTLRGRQTIAWMAVENKKVNEDEVVIRLDASWYMERIQQETFEVAKLNLQIQKKSAQLKKEERDLQGELALTEIEKKLADIYQARDKSIFTRNKIIEDAINLEFLEEKAEHYTQKKEKLEEKSLTEIELLQLKKRTHQVRLKQYNHALDSLNIKAPHNGLLIYRRDWRGEIPRVGMNVYRGRKLAELPNLTEMEAKLFVLESEAAGLKEGLPVSFVLDSSPDFTFSGKVTTIDTLAKSIKRDSPLKYFEIKSSIHTTDTEIMKPGCMVRGNIFVQKEENVISVPNQALFFEDSKTFVNIKTGNVIKKREVVIGARSLTQTVITEGLKEGEKVILSEYNKGG